MNKNKIGKGPGRPKKDKSLEKLTEIFFERFPKDSLREILKEHIKNEDNKEELMKYIDIDDDTEI